MLRPSAAGAAALLPAKGVMFFDTADLAEMEREGTLNDVITHEMGHVLGIGTIWRDKGLLAGSGTERSDVHRCRARSAEYAALLDGGPDEETEPGRPPSSGAGGEHAAVRAPVRGTGGRRSSAPS